MADILVVDDAAVMRSIIRNHLLEMGHKVVGEASNGREAAESYEVLFPDLVIMDITMPEVSGLEGIKKIKKIDPNAKIIICSAMGQEFMILDAIKFGALDFIVKPFKKDRIKKAIAKILNN